MKSRTLVMITAAIITAAVLVLTAGLSLMHSSAIEENPAPAESRVPVSEVPKEEPENAYETDMNEKKKEAENREEEQIDLEPTCDNVDCDYPYHFSYDVVVAIYEHATGKLVSQKIYTDDQIWNDIHDLHLGVYSRGECIFDPRATEGQEEVTVCIPESEYRIEVFAIWSADEHGSGELAFAYSYGADSDYMEMWASGVLYSGGDLFIEYVDNLIADQMAEVEAGTAVAPSEDEAITSIIGFDIINLSVPPFSQSVWTGDFYGPFKRETPRFPYLED